MNLNELRDWAYKNAVDHGWHEKDLSDEHFLCLVISELMEAVEADRKGSHGDIEAFNRYYDRIDFEENFERQIKDTVEDELADACIRLLDLAGLRKADLGETNEDELRCSEGFFNWTFAESIFSFPYGATIRLHRLKNNTR